MGRDVAVRLQDGPPIVEADAEGLVIECLADPLAAEIARGAARRSLPPPVVLGVGLALGFLAAVWFSLPHVGPRLVAAAALAASFVVGRAGCLLADRTGHGSPAPPPVAWLSVACATMSEYAVYAGLAASAGLSGAGVVWWLAVGAMLLHAVRHLTDLCYERVAAASTDAGEAPRALPRRLVRSLALPAGERMLLVAVCGALAGPRPTFLALLGWGGVAFCVDLVRRVVARCRRDAQLRRDAVRTGRAVGRVTGRMLPPYRDDGPLALRLGRAVRGQLPPLPPAVVGMFVVATLAGVGFGAASGALILAPVAAMLLAGLGSTHPHDGAADWLVPPLLLSGEYVFFAMLAHRAGLPPPLVFAVAAGVALRHLDVGYRARSALTWRPNRLVDLGWDARMALVGVVAAFGAVAFVCVAACGYLWVLLGWEFLTGWLGAREVAGR